MKKEERPLRGLRATYDAPLDLEHAFSRIPEEMIVTQQNTNPVDFRVIVEGARKPLHPVLRDEVYRIGREALMNAFRHAQAKRIEMEIKYSMNRFGILVRDDGRGINPDVLQAGRDRHWGLVGMRERADHIGARLHVLSRVSAGTKIELSVPGKLAYQKDSYGSSN